METQDIFLPVAALALWTLLVLGLVPIARFRAAAAGRVTIHDFKTGESPQVPPDVSVPNRVFMNLLEVPVLFYLACIVAFLTHHVESRLITLAWVYVGLRVAHSLVYLIYNNVMHRLGVFAVSNFVVFAIWLMLTSQLIHV
jgi:hypothetical protein